MLMIYRRVITIKPTGDSVSTIWCDIGGVWYNYCSIHHHPKCQFCFGIRDGVLISLTFGGNMVNLHWIINKLSRILKPDDLIYQLSQDLRRFFEHALEMEALYRKDEDRFNRIGRRFQSLYSQTVALTTKVNESIAYIGEKTDGSLLGSVEVLSRTSFAKMIETQSGIRNKIDPIQAILSSFQQLNQKLQGLEKIGLYLKVIGYHIRIESSRNKKADETFSILAKEITEFSRKVIQTAEQLETDLEKAQAFQTAAVNVTKKDIQSLEALTEHSLKKALDEVDRFSRLSAEKLGEVEAKTGDIFENVENISLRIQQHDSISQRIDHIIKSMRELMEMNHFDDSDSFSRNRTISVYKTMKLQLAQIEHCIADIEDIRETCSASMKSMDRNIDSIIASLLDFIGNSASDAAGLTARSLSRKNPFTALEDKLSDVKDLLYEGSEIVGRIQQTAVKVSRTTLKAAEEIQRLQDISIDLRFKAFNAMISAAHLGESGRKFEVLAKEMKRLSETTTSFSNETEGLLETVELQLDPLKEAVDIRYSDYVDSIDRSISEGRRELEKAKVHLKRTSSEVLPSADALKSVLAASRDELGFLDDLAGRLAQSHGKMKGILDRLSFRMDIPESESSDEFLSPHYTTAQERMIHERTMKRKPDPEEPDRDDVSSMEHFENNVEFF